MYLITGVIHGDEVEGVDGVVGSVPLRYVHRFTHTLYGHLKLKRWSGIVMQKYVLNSAPDFMSHYVYVFPGVSFSFTLIYFLPLSLYFFSIVLLTVCSCLSTAL